MGLSNFILASWWEEKIIPIVHAFSFKIDNKTCCEFLSKPLRGSSRIIKSGLPIRADARQRP